MERFAFSSAKSFPGIVTAAIFNSLYGFGLNSMDLLRTEKCGSYKWSYVLSLQGWKLILTCFKCCIYRTFIELFLCKYEKVVSLSSSPSIVCKAIRWRKNIFFQQTSQSWSTLKTNQYHKSFFYMKQIQQEMGIYEKSFSILGDYTTVHVK